MATIIIGAGIGGLAAAIVLGARGENVTVLERQHGAGGKLLPLTIDNTPIDSGPTVLTMRWVFDELFSLAGYQPDDLIKAKPLSTLARHYWSGNKSLDLFADRKQTEQAIGEFAGLDAAQGYADFAIASQRMHQSLLSPFLKSQRPTPWGLTASMPLSDVMRINPFETLWSALGRYFKDERLRQLFGRYATYCGSSPFKSPATLMLVADVEAAGVWRLSGGMASLASALQTCARKLGVTFHFNTEAQEIITANGNIEAVIDQHGVRHPCKNIIVNADSAAVAYGLFGNGIKNTVSVPKPQQRSLSAVTWCGKIKSSGVPLEHHTVFFSDNYHTEFSQVASGTANDPTVYICDQGNDHKLVLINAAANGLQAPDAVKDNVIHRLARSGLALELDEKYSLQRSPKDFAALYPATHGALYGRASHGWLATFLRPQAKTEIRGLYLAGGSTHPGPGVPMAALSGMRAAEALLSDRPLTRR